MTSINDFIQCMLIISITIGKYEEASALYKPVRKKKETQELTTEWISE